jgi:hypothetical protein
MAFVILAEFLALIYFFRLDIRRYLRPLLAHLPALVLMSFWTIALLTRYKVMLTYLTGPINLRDITRFWAFLGTGCKVELQAQILIAANLPFLFGLLIGVRKWKDRPGVLAIGLVGGISLLVIIAFSFRNSIFFDRYMLFLVPIFLALSLFGWMELPSRAWSNVGTTLVFGILLMGQVLYWSHYHQAVDHYRHQGLYWRPKDDDGRSMSRMATLVQERLEPQEAVIHYSAEFTKNLSYFTFVYYHKRRLPEYVYSLTGIPQNAGQQYLRPGDLIKSLRDLPQLPSGIWVVTLNPTYVLVRGSQASREAQWIIAAEGDLPGELKEFGYDLQETIRDGAVAVLHFRRAAAVGHTLIPERGK